MKKDLSPGARERVIRAHRFGNTNDFVQKYISRTRYTYTLACMCVYLRLVSDIGRYTAAADERPCQVFLLKSFFFSLGRIPYAGPATLAVRLLYVIRFNIINEHASGVPIENINNDNNARAKAHAPNREHATYTHTIYDSTKYTTTLCSMYLLYAYDI